MEAHNYPIFSVIYHPEYRMMMDPSPETIEIATQLSKYLFSEAVKNLRDRQAKGLQVPDETDQPQPVDSMNHQLNYFGPGRNIPAFGINKHIGRRWFGIDEGQHTSLEKIDDSHKLYSKEAMKDG